jgi:hypothetical protein
LYHYYTYFAITHIIEMDDSLYIPYQLYLTSKNRAEVRIGAGPQFGVTPIALSSPNWRPTDHPFQLICMVSVVNFLTEILDCVLGSPQERPITIGDHGNSLLFHGIRNEFPSKPRTLPNFVSFAKGGSPSWMHNFTVISSFVSYRSAITPRLCRWNAS